jgi:HK97 family phage major capsid protein
MSMVRKVQPRSEAPDPEEVRKERIASMARAVLAEAKATFESNREGAALRLVRAAWPSDRMALRLVTKAASAPAMTTTTGWAAELATIRVEELLSTFGPASAGAELLQMGHVLTWDSAAKISVPGFSAASATFATFVAQGQSIPVRQFVTSSGVSLDPRKLATIFTLTHEMISASSAEQLVRMVMTDSLSASLDAALFSNTAGDASRPPGLLVGVTPITAATGVGAMVADLAALLAAVSPMCGMDVAYVTNPSTVLKIALTAAPGFDLLGLPVLASNGVAAGTVICVGVNALVSAFDPEPRIDASRDIEVPVMMDTAPPSDGSIGSVALKSMFQTDTVAIRFIGDVAWGLRSPSAISFVSGITW